MALTLTALGVMCFAVFARRATAGCFEGFVEAAETLEAGGEGYIQNRLVACNQQSLCVRNTVPGNKVIHRCSERLSKQIHRVVGMYAIRLSD